jgi:peptide/nickel transport system substrate-binding protein
VATSAGGGERLLTKDLDKAKQLLTESGYQGEQVVLMDPTDHPSHAAALVTAANLRTIGVNVDVQAMDWATLTQRRASKKSQDDGGWNIFHTRFNGASSSNPITHIGINTNCDKAWFGWPCDTEIEKLRSDFATTSDATKRADIAKALQLRALQTLPYVPLGQLHLVRGYSAKLSGILNAAVPVYWNIRKAP